MKIRRFLAALLAALLTMGATGEASAVTWLEADTVADRFVANPRNVKDIGDPYVLVENGAYHVFATGGPLGFFHWGSDDLVSFERTKALQKAKWASGDYWAPEVYAWQGRYVMFYTARWKENGGLRIGVAFADQVEGPYEDALDAPLFDPGYAVIDGSLYVDDGVPYLLFVRDCSDNVVNGVHESHVYGVRLADDLLSIAGEPVRLTQPDAAWETTSADWRWNEGPFVVKHDGRYYLYYSVNHFQDKAYSVGVAVADAILGPYVKQANNPILTYVEQDGKVIVSGPGHNALFMVGDELFTSYHTHTYPLAPSGNRQLCIDRAGFHKDGTAYIDGPTLAGQLRPLGEMGLVNHMASALCAEDPDGLLTDGDTCQAASSAAYVFQGETAVFTWQNPVTADLLLLYPALGAPVAGTVSIDGESLDFALSPALPGEALILPFESQAVSELRVTLSEGRLGEVMLIGQ